MTSDQRRTPGGKGDRARSVDRETWDRNWTRIFRPCTHPGCRNHVSHPCEECGYIGDEPCTTVEHDNSSTVEPSETPPLANPDPT